MALHGLVEFGKPNSNKPDPSKRKFVKREASSVRRPKKNKTAALLPQIGSIWPKSCLEFWEVIVSQALNTEQNSHGHGLIPS